MNMVDGRWWLSGWGDGLVKKPGTEKKAGDDVRTANFERAR